MGSFVRYFIIGSAIGAAATAVTALITGHFFLWMAPIAGMIHGTLRALHVEEDMLG